MIFIQRPRRPSAKSLAEKKTVLKFRTQELMLLARGTLAEQEDFDENKEDYGWCYRYSFTNKLKDKKKNLKVEFHKLERQLEIFEMENHLTANPLLDVLQLIGGIFFALLGLVFLIHILCFKLIAKNGKPVHGLLNDLMLFVEYKMARFISTIIFVAIGTDT